MIVVDASAVIAILQREPEAPALRAAIADANHILISARQRRLPLLFQGDDFSKTDIQSAMGGPVPQ